MPRKTHTQRKRHCFTAPISCVDSQWEISALGGAEITWSSPFIKYLPAHSQDCTLFRIAPTITFPAFDCTNASHKRTPVLGCESLVYVKGAQRFILARFLRLFARFLFFPVSVLFLHHPFRLHKGSHLLSSRSCRRGFTFNRTHTHIFLQFHPLIKKPLWGYLLI